MPYATASAKKDGHAAMRHHAITLAAVTATVVSLPVNLPAVHAGKAGAAAFLMSAAVALLWLAVALLCNPWRPPLAVLGAVPGLIMLATVAGFVLPLLGINLKGALQLSWMLALAPFYGLTAISAGLPQSVVTASAWCGMVLLLGLLLRWRRGAEETERAQR